MTKLSSKVVRLTIFDNNFEIVACRGRSCYEGLTWVGWQAAVSKLTDNNNTISDHFGIAAFLSGVGWSAANAATLSDKNAISDNFGISFFLWRVGVNSGNFETDTRKTNFTEFRNWQFLRQGGMDSGDLETDQKDHIWDNAGSLVSCDGVGWNKDRRAFQGRNF